MKTLQNCTIPELIALLEQKGVTWVGSTTRKAPLIDLLDDFQPIPDYVNTGVDLTIDGLRKGLEYPWCYLVGVLKYYGHTVTSEEIDYFLLKQRVLEVAR